MLAIVNLEVSDAHVNELAWSCLGYARNGYDLDTDDLTVKEMWDTAQVFPNWLKRFPEPPDFLGVKRDYRPEIDAPVKVLEASRTYRCCAGTCGHSGVRPSTGEQRR